MATMKSATRKSGPGSTWRAITDGFSHGAPYELIKRGTSYRGDHPAVLASPELFAAGDTSDQELRELEVERFGSYEVNNLNPPIETSGEPVYGMVPGMRRY